MNWKEAAKTSIIAGLTISTLLGLWPEEAFAGKKHARRVHTKQTDERPLSEKLDELVTKSIRSKESENISYAAVDLETGEYVARKNEDKPILAASVNKAYVALDYLYNVKEGKVFEPCYEVTLRDGSIVAESPDTILEKMITESSECERANVMINMLGGAQAVEERLYKNFGYIFKDTKISIIPPDRRDYSSMTSVNDAIRFLTALHKQELPESARLLGILNKVNSYRMYKGSANKEEVAEKTGTTAKSINIIALSHVYDKEGVKHSYIFVAFFSSMERFYDEPQIKSARINMLRNISRMTYQDLVEKKNQVKRTSLNTLVPGILSYDNRRH